MRPARLDLALAAPDAAPLPVWRARRRRRALARGRRAVREPPVAAWCRSGAATTAVATAASRCRAAYALRRRPVRGSSCALPARRRPTRPRRPSSRARRACSARRADLLGIARRGRGDRGPGCDHGAWPPSAVPAAPRLRAQRTAAAGRRARRLSIRARRGRRRARDPGRAGARRHHRAGPLPLLDRRREGAAPRRAPRLHAQGHRAGASRDCSLAEAHRLAGRVSGDSTVAYAWAYVHGARSRPRGCASPPRAPWLRALLLERERIANHLGDLGRARQRRRLRLRPGAVLAPEGRLAARESRRPSATAS